MIKIINQMNKNRENVKIFDPWVSSEEESCKILESFGTGYHIINNEAFFITHTPSGGAGMGAYPETYTIYILKKFKEKK